MSETPRKRLSQALRHWPTVLVSAIAIIVGWFVLATSDSPNMESGIGYEH